MTPEEILEAVDKFKRDGLETRRKEIVRLHRKPELKILFLEVTLRCNAKCEHCGSSCGYKFPKDEISADELKKALLEISQRYDPKEIFLNITGGEPLMRKDLFDIMKYAVSLGFDWGMTSNGMLIDDKVIEQMRESKMASISISIDGLKETHETFRKVPGCYEKIIEGIKKMQKLDTIGCIEITTVANKKNLHELEDIYQMLLDLGITFWRLVTIDPIGRANDNDEILLSKEEFKYVFDFLRDKKMENKMHVEYGCSHYLGISYELVLRDYFFKCMAGLNVGSILSNGDICVCPNVRRKELVQGNIKTDSFCDVWENKFKEFRTERLTTNSKCKKCKSFKYCRGDSLHTWNFEEHKPNICMKEILGEDFIE